MSPANDNIGELLPRPDPSVLTTAQLLRAIAAERDITTGQIAVIKERLDAMDRATSLVAHNVDKVPSEITEQVTHLRDLNSERFGSITTQFDEKFKSVALQFAERDTRGEREARDNTLKVDAAARRDRNPAVGGRGNDQWQQRVDRKPELPDRRPIRQLRGPDGGAHLQGRPERRGP